MNTFFRRICAFTSIFFGLAILPLQAATTGGLNIGVVNFKQCVEDSKLGKQEQTNFDKLKKQMETVLEEKEKVLNGLIEESEDQNTTLTEEAKNDLRRKLQALSQEMGQLQNQYLQALNQAQFKIVQKINEVITRASKAVAKAQNLDLVMNDESMFDYSDKFDVSSAVVKEMDVLYEKEDMGANLETSEALDRLNESLRTA